MILRLLNWQGIAGIAASIALAALLLVQGIQTRHWRDRSASFERLYDQERADFAETVANARAAAETARAADRANVERVAAAQRTITERTANDFETRIAAARAHAADAARRLRDAAQAAPDPGARGAAPVPGLPAPARGADQAAGQDRLPPPDALIATEQAIQLDELIKWVAAQVRVDNNAPVAPNAGKE